MPGKEFPLSIILRAVDKASIPLKAVERALGSVEKKLSKIGDKSIKIGKSLTKNISAPVLALGAAGVKSLVDFEDGMSNISTLVDTSTESMDAMGKKVLEISRRTPVAIEDLTSALYDTRSAGVKAGDAMTVLERSAQLGVAGLGTTAEAVDLVTSSFNAFGLEGKDAEKVYDNIFKTVKNGKTTIAALSQGFGAVAGTVAATGTPLDEYLASVAALTTTGQKASQAHTQMKAVIAGLTRDTSHTRKVFRDLGAKDLKGLIAKYGGLVPALEKVSESLGGNQSKILKLVGSTEALNAVIGLTGGQNKAFSDTLSDMRDGAEAVGEAFEKQNKTTSAGLKRTKNALTSAAISIGKILAPIVEKLAKKLEALSQWWEALDDDTKETIVTIAAVAATVGPALIVLGKMATAIAAVSKAVGFMNSVILANPIAALTAAMTFAVVKIISEWESFEEFFSLLWDTITGDFEVAAMVINDIVDGIASAANKVLDIKSVLLGEETSKQRAIREEGEQVQRDVGAFLAEVERKDMESEAKLREAVAAGRLPASMLEGGGTSKISIDFQNAPAGMRVKTQSDERSIDVTTGYQLGTP